MYIGLDIGTSSAKALLVSERGEVLACASRAYPIHTSDGLELRPAEVWTAVCAVLSELAACGTPVRGIGLSSLGEAAVVMDEQYRPLCASILPGDPRGIEEAANEDAGLPERTGLPVSATYTLYKLLWMAKHMPDVYKKIRHVMLYGDYIGYMLTGNAAISRSLASRTSVFDVHENVFFTPHQEIERSWFSVPVEADTRVGRLRDSVAAQLGLPFGTPVFAGGHDQPCAAVGCGAVTAGMVSDSVGTSECFAVHMGDRQLTAEQITAYNFPNEPFLEHGEYGTIAYTHTAGKMVDWYLHSVLRRTDSGAAESMAERCGQTPSGLLVLPHLSGSGTPKMDPNSVGAIIGLNLATDDVSIYRGILEGVSYEMRLNMQCLVDMGIPVSRIIANGGGANSHLWLQMKADIYQRTVSVPSCRDASAMGAALAAATGLHDFDTVTQASKALVRWRNTYYPNDEHAAQYETLYERYRNVYDAICMVRKDGNPHE